MHVINEAYQRTLTYTVDAREKGATEIIEEVMRILQSLRVTDYIEFEPESVGLLEGSTYVVRDTVNNIEVYYNVNMGRMIRLVVGFEW